MLMLIMPAIILLSSVIWDEAKYHGSYQTFIHEHYLGLTGRLRGYDRDLFDRFGLMGIVKKEDCYTYSGGLDNDEVLKTSIVKLMRYRAVDALEDEILSRIDDNIYCKDILNVLEELEETLALKDSINSGISKGEGVGGS